MRRGPLGATAGMALVAAFGAIVLGQDKTAPARPEPGGAELPSLANIWVGERASRKTVEGNLIDLNCYVEHGGVGEKHRRCARACAEKGMPVGLIDRTGHIYLVSGWGHVPPMEVNRPLLELLETTVIVTGDFFEHEDLKMAVVREVIRSPRQLSPEELRALYKGPVN